MKETTLIYKQSLDENINEELKYQKKYGALTKKKLLSPILFYLALSAAIFLLSLFDNSRELGSDPVMIAMLVIIIIAGAVIQPILSKKSTEKNIISKAAVYYDFSLDSKKPNQITLSENGIELLSPYGKAHVPYEEAERVISDKFCFVIKLKGTDQMRVIPKRGQDPKTLFDFDNIFREKLADRFVYEM
ncbi:MAG: YcxB family protein [Acutalibacteraceae bacterium]|nr:YcxB family protein [Oscillospiraceae bacterium]